METPLAQREPPVFHYHPPKPDEGFDVDELLDPKLKVTAISQNTTPIQVVHKGKRATTGEPSTGAPRKKASTQKDTEATPRTEKLKRTRASLGAALGAVSNKQGYNINKLLKMSAKDGSDAPVAPSLLTPLHTTKKLKRQTTMFDCFKSQHESSASPSPSGPSLDSVSSLL